MNCVCITILKVMWFVTIMNEITKPCELFPSDADPFKNLKQHFKKSSDVGKFSSLNLQKLKMPNKFSKIGWKIGFPRKLEEYFPRKLPDCRDESSLNTANETTENVKTLNEPSISSKGEWITEQKGIFEERPSKKENGRNNSPSIEKENAPNIKMFKIDNGEIEDNLHCEVKDEPLEALSEVLENHDLGPVGSPEGVKEDARTNEPVEGTKRSSKREVQAVPVEGPQPTLSESWPSGETDGSLLKVYIDQTLANCLECSPEGSEDMSRLSQGDRDIREKIERFSSKCPSGKVKRRPCGVRNKRGASVVGARLFRCAVCPFSSLLKSVMKRHMEVHGGQKNFVCPFCSLRSSTNSNLLRHMKLHSGEKPFKCPRCSYRSAQKADIKSHFIVHTGEKPFKCPHCSFRTARKVSLSTHIKTHTGERPFKCSVCAFTSITKTGLKSHIRIHTGERPYECEYCSYRTITKSELTTHARMHTGERPYDCAFCSYRAARKFRLTLHMRIHTGERPFRCCHCPYKAIAKGDLQKHIRIHTGERPYKCALCPYRAAQKYSLTLHLKIHDKCKG